jgi:hypothetical protein
MLTQDEMNTIELAKKAGMDMPALSIHPLEWWYYRAVEFLADKTHELDDEEA